MVVIDTSAPHHRPRLGATQRDDPDRPGDEGDDERPEVGPDEQTGHRALPGQVRPWDPADPG
jgi:hypothetical protein